MEKKILVFYKKSCYSKGGGGVVTLAEKIKQVREKKGMTQKEVASLMGISQQAYGQYESGGRVPKTETVTRIAEALGVDYYTLDSESFATDKLSPTFVLDKRMREFIERQMAAEKTITLQSAQEEWDKLVQKLMKVNHKISEAELRNAVPLYGEDDLRRFIEKVNWEAGEAIRAEEEKKLLEKFRRLNKTGKKVAVERVEELTQIPKYQCKDAAAELKMG
ncbi:MAG: helix-turn-helix domain-containing protein [Faecalibacterium prausnitzii]|nr:helix-turn-helix domain-containing protein [Faecalibacterium prausnitzii]